MGIAHTLRHKGRHRIRPAGRALGGFGLGRQRVPGDQNVQEDALEEERLRRGRGRFLLDEPVAHAHLERDGGGQRRTLGGGSPELQRPAVALQSALGVHRVRKLDPHRLEEIIISNSRLQYRNIILDTYTKLIITKLYGNVLYQEFY